MSELQRLEACIRELEGKTVFEMPGKIQPVLDQFLKTAQDFESRLQYLEASHAEN